MGILTFSSGEENFIAFSIIKQKAFSRISEMKIYSINAELIEK